ncbi:MAG TPA: hypothetical protein VKT29_15885 [Terriglobales bacterium]|nr:hypothetical protein [Terriglobales bacterium]
MTFHSPFDDFVLNSLAAVDGLLSKLDYVAGLRQENGAYTHWGLARVHGENAAHEAALEAHRLLLSRILSTPLAHLLQDAAQCPSACELGLRDYLEYLSQRLPVLSPEGTGRGPSLHLNSVLLALSALARSQSRTSPQAS